jgi:hypothetical protein
MNEELESTLNEIKKRFADFSEGSDDQKDFLAHLHSMARWNKEPMDYPEVDNVSFPKDISIAHAICHPECGVQEFIVDGSTQQCQGCGGLMFRGEVRKYRLIE